MPDLTIFAGPNGSGKSSTIVWFGFEGKENLLDPDAIAKRINKADPRCAAVAAGREVIRRTQEYVNQRQSFAIETTLAGQRVLGAIRSASEAGFFVRLIYLCLDSPERCMQRVQERVSHGGHDIPDEDIRRRYNRSLKSLPEVLHLVHEAVVYDNCGTEPRKMLEIRTGIITWRAASQPLWVNDVVAAMRQG
ncbi:MAG TPA: AAA family ATPase [Bryobacteraceae bacterium]